MRQGGGHEVATRCNMALWATVEQYGRVVKAAGDGAHADLDPAASAAFADDADGTAQSTALLTWKLPWLRDDVMRDQGAGLLAHHTGTLNECPTQMPAIKIDGLVKRETNEQPDACHLTAAVLMFHGIPSDP